MAESPKQAAPGGLGLPAVAFGHLPPIDGARRQYVELFGSALVMNTYLKIAVLALSLVACGLIVLNIQTARRFAHVKPLVIRIDEVGRAQAVAYDAMTYRPVGQAPELKYFLVQFVTKHYGRMRATVKAQYAESLFFLEASLAEATIAHDQRERTIERFLTSSSDEIEIQVRNVTLEDLGEPPYKAVVEFDRVYYALGNHQEHVRETCVAHVTFVVRDQVPNAAIPVNPLGLTVTYVRVDQAFR
jgi:type IV secretory pathway TrbF-like protein